MNARKKRMTMAVAVAVASIAVAAVASIAIAVAVVVAHRLATMIIPLQSMNFLKELALKRQTQRRSHLDKIKTESDTESKTPEAKLLNQVSEDIT